MKISVVIPCFNAQRHIGQAIRSALEQSHPPREVLVVDDGSTDDSASIVNGFGAPVRLLESEHVGAAGARNRGARMATGNAVMFLDADDVLGPTALAAGTTGLKREREGVVLLPWKRMVWEEGKWVERPPSCAVRRPGQDALSAWLEGWYHPTSSVLWSRVGFERAGGWDDTIPHNPNDDGELMMRAHILGVPFVRVPEGTVYYRRPREGVATLSGSRFQAEGLSARLQVFRKLIGLLEQEKPEEMDTYRSQFALALEDLAADAGEEFLELRAQALELADRLFGPEGLRRKVRKRRARSAKLVHLLTSLRHPGRALRRRLTPSPEVTVAQEADRPADHRADPTESGGPGAS